MTNIITRPNIIAQFIKQKKSIECIINEIAVADLIVGYNYWHKLSLTCLLTIFDGDNNTLYSTLLVDPSE